MNVIGCVPVQVPVVPVSTEPCIAVPLTAGKAVFTGGAVTTAVAADVAGVELTLFIPVTTTRSVDPTSAAANV